MKCPSSTCCSTSLPRVSMLSGSSSSASMACKRVSLQDQHRKDCRHANNLPGLLLEVCSESHLLCRLCAGELEDFSGAATGVHQILQPLILHHRLSSRLQAGIELLQCLPRTLVMNLLKPAATASVDCSQMAWLCCTFIACKCSSVSTDLRHRR